MNSNATTGLVLAAALLAAVGAFGQCDTTTPGNFTDTQFDSGTDCNGGHDDNGGWNETTPTFLEAGTYGPDNSFRVTGVVGTFNKQCDGGDDNSRDLDWIRFTVTDSGYITVSLSMRDSSGNPLDGTNAYDVLFIQQGSDSNTSVGLYGEYGTDGCPHVAMYTFPNGSKQTRFPVDAGDYLVIVTTPFPTLANQSLFHGPMAYGLNVVVEGYDRPLCGNSTNECWIPSSTGGCSDGLCCDLVCGFTPQCCDSAWDANCVLDAIDQCGIICDGPRCTCSLTSGIPNDCAMDAELVPSLPAFISFDCTNADTDGPNDVARLCSSSTAHDLWYVVGPTLYAGELMVSMCGQGNTGDAVISMFDLGQTGEIGNPSKLPSKYVACRDDTCDDDGDGNIDLAGPAGIKLIGIPAGEFILVRVGSFLDPANPNAPGYVGSLEISFRAVFVDHGLQSVVNNAGTNTNLGLISGWSTAANTKRWSMIPFVMPVSGVIDGFDFAAFDNTTPDEVSWKVVSRNVGTGDPYGDFGRPFGATGVYDAGQVVASGAEPMFMTEFANVGDDYQQRFFIDLSSPFALDPGNYYFTCYGSYSDGSSGASFAWLLYGRNSMLQKTTAAVTISAADAASATSQGTFAAGTPFGWRGTGTGPKFCFYNLGPAYTVQPGDDPGLLYQCAFNLKGRIVASCFGDLDNSGEVDGGDIGLLLLDYGSCPGCSSDLDGSGEVDGGDIGLVLLSFGACP